MMEILLEDSARVYPPSHQSWLLASGRYLRKYEILLLVIRRLIKTCKVEMRCPGAASQPHLQPNYTSCRGETVI